jgi:flagellar protein FlgJ
MLRPDSAATPSTLPAQATAPVRAAAGGSGGGFGGLIGEVRADVADFIENGSADTLPPVATMAPPAADALPASLASFAPVVRPDRDTAAAATAPDQHAFLQAIAPYAEQTGARLGVAPEIVAAHAALESGWGKKPLRDADGGDTHNLFGLKAGAAWQGGVADALTTEYDAAGPTTKVERFRSYADPAGAFDDYAQLLLDNPRYHSALNAGSDARAFAQGLARGGYATDPAYADKLVRLAQRLRSQ